MFGGRGLETVTESCGSSLASTSSLDSWTSASFGSQAARLESSSIESNFRSFSSRESGSCGNAFFADCLPPSPGQALLEPEVMPHASKASFAADPDAARDHATGSAAFDAQVEEEGIFVMEL